MKKALTILFAISLIIITPEELEAQKQDKIDVLIQRNKYEKAESLLTQVLKVHPDYFEAYEIYQRYDEKHRAKLIESLTDEVNNSLKRIEELKGLENESYILEIEVELCKIEYENLESRYNAISNTYQKKQAELESAKRNLTTAITVVFLSSLGFFFIGQKSARGNILEQQKISTGVEDK